MGSLVIFPKARGLYRLENNNQTSSEASLLEAHESQLLTPLIYGDQQNIAEVMERHF